MGVEHTRELKHNFAQTGESISTAHALGVRVGAVHPDLSPGALSHEQLGGGKIIMGETGHLAALRHPTHIPTAIDGNNVDFGGVPSTTHIEVSMARLSPEHAQASAQSVIDSLATHGLRATHSKHGGVLGVGLEMENWVSDPDGSLTILPDEYQEELHAHLWETAMVPVLTPAEQAAVMAQDVLDRADAMPENIITNTSVPITGHVSEALLNQSGPIKPYVLAMQTKLYDLLHPSDPVTRGLWDDLAKRQGYEDFDNMKTSVGDLSMWPMAAAHASLGMGHDTDEYGRASVHMEHVLAVGDTFNSNLASVAEWMTFSTPVVLSTRPQVDKLHPRDCRATLKYGLLTTHPGDFVMTAENMVDTIADGIVSGRADRIDRASYVGTSTLPDGTETRIARGHGRVRNRITHGNWQNPTAPIGRVEYTGAGSTPDITATVARNSYLQLLQIAALEAVAQGQHPQEYWGATYPAITTNVDQIELTHRYNYHGIHDEQAADVIDQAYHLVGDMQDRYGQDEDMKTLCESARTGLDKLVDPATARTLEEYADSGYRGLIADVIATMYEDGYEPAEIARAVHDFQIRQAREILAAQVDHSELDEPVVMSP